MTMPTLTLIRTRELQDKKARKLTKKRVCLRLESHTVCLVMDVPLMRFFTLQLGTLLRSKRKLEELGTIIQESRRAH